jgi:hypothetical protein
LKIQKLTHFTLFNSHYNSLYTLENPKTNSLYTL